MRKILFAAIGARPDKKAFSYALQLSQQMGAELNVLQMLKMKEAPDDVMNAPGVRYYQRMLSGNPYCEIIDYLDKHRDVVCIVYDGFSQSRSELDKIRKNLESRMPVPLIVVH